MRKVLKPSVFYFNDDVLVYLTQKKKLKLFIEYLFKMEKKTLNSLTFVFCSDSKLLDINKQYLKHNYFTDIITFDLTEKGSGIVGEIYISIERVKENARNHKVSFKSELHRVIFHGALHLCGYKDKSVAQQKIIRNKEDFYLAQYLSVPRDTP